MQTTQKIKFKHIRNTYFVLDDYTNYEDYGIPMIDNLGGATIAYTVNNDDTIDFATAYCSPKDNFCKATGRTISSGRLMSPRYSAKFHGSEAEFHDTMNSVFYQSGY